MEVVESGAGSQPEMQEQGATESGVVSGEPLLRSDAEAPAPIQAGWDAEPVVLDWFGEGKADLLVSSGGDHHARTVRIFRRLDASADLPSRYDEGTELPALSGLRLLCPIPGAGEARFDLVALAPEGLVYLPNEGTHSAPKFPTRLHLGFGPHLGLGTGRISQMTAEDWDGDGRTDLLVGFDELTDYWADSPQVPVSQQVGFNQMAGHPGYDRNGNWRGRAPHGKLFWLRNEGDPGSPKFQRPQEIGSEAGALQLPPRPAALTVSWGGGRAWELLLTDSEGLVRLHRNFGGQRPPVLMEPRPLKVENRPLTLPDDRQSIVTADIEGDGKPELVFGTADGRVLAVHAGNGRDQAREPEPLLCDDRTLRFGAHAVVAAADLDADGDLDLVAGDARGCLFLAENLGGLRFATPTALEAGGLPFRLDPGPDGVLLGPAQPRLGFAAPLIVDWKNNGRPDLIVGGAGGEVLFFRNNGGATEPRFDRPEALRLNGGPLITPPRVRPAAADFQGECQIDLVALDLQGFLCVYPRTDTIEVGPPLPLVDRLGRRIRLDGAFGLGGRCSLWAGPWTGSGRPDLLVGLSRRSRFVIPAITGVAVENLEELPTVLLLENLGRGVMVPRLVHLADGGPLVVGIDGCSPCGVETEASGALDLLVGLDDGRVVIYRREDLHWK